MGGRKSEEGMGEGGGEATCTILWARDSVAYINPGCAATWPHCQPAVEPASCEQYSKPSQPRSGRAVTEPATAELDTKKLSMI